MEMEKIIIIMLLYVLGCVVVYFLATKYIIDRRTRQNADTDTGNSLIDELEVERNIFDISKKEDGIDDYEIDSPYKKTTVDDLLEEQKKKGKSNGFQNRIRKLLE